MIEAVLYGGPQDGLRMAVVYPAPNEIVFARRPQINLVTEASETPIAPAFEHDRYRLRFHPGNRAIYDYAGCG